jgi:hypothetical protein
MSVERIPEEGNIRLPNGCTLYWKANEVGGRTYYTDEIPCGVMVWDTALTDESTLLAALTQEATIQRNERYWDEQDKKGD